jgi:hypothetical protein
MTAHPIPQWEPSHAGQQERMARGYVPTGLDILADLDHAAAALSSYPRALSTRPAIWTKLTLGCTP